MPRADVIPTEIRSALALVPTKTNLLGVKGGSEASNVGMPAAIINAVIAAWGQRDSVAGDAGRRLARDSKRGVLKAAAQE